MQKFFRSLTAATLAAVSFSTFAATDGIVGNSSSSGNFDITLNVAPQIIVANFGNMALDTATATLGSPVEGYEDICVGGIGFANYSVNLASSNGTTGGGSGAPFQLNGTAQNLPYTASFVDNTTGTTGTTADTGTGDVAGSFPRASNVSCATDNARVIVAIASADWESATESSYTDTLTVTVAAL